MDSSKKASNKIRDIVRLQQILKKWKKVAHASKINANNNTNYISLPPIIKRSSSNNNLINNPTNNNTNSSGSKSIKFLKKTLSFTESSMSSNSSSSNDGVPKGYLAVSVGRDEEEKKRFVIPMEYLGHPTFVVLLREAEEEFGFQQEGVLKIPCEVPLFEKIMKMMQHKKKNEVALFLHEDIGFETNEQNGSFYSSPDRHSCEPTPSHHAQLCR
ncbi:hypothetical protein Leryth_001839 [Lithospermum erythrorhizon]|nr:hypothetical protein Leryth_001839 [Lithospermum erythrorhizon]